MNQPTQDILKNNTYAVLSTTCADGAPWGTPVHFAFDEQNIYWISADQALHSQNIMQQPKVFLTIYDSRQAGADERAALYIATTAKTLEGEAAKIAHDTVYAGRFTTSRGVGDGAHIYAAPIGVLNEQKSKNNLLYYHASSAGESA